MDGFRAHRGSCRTRRGAAGGWLRILLLGALTLVATAPMSAHGAGGAAAGAGVTGPAPEAPLQPPMQDWFPKAPPPPRPPEKVVRVATVAELIEAVEEAEPGQTVLVADGHYFMPHYVEIRADDVTLRGASGRRERVILDGAQSRHGELLGLRACSGVTVADLTIQNVKWNGLKLNSETNVQRVTIHNCIFHNVWQRGIKGVKVPAQNRETIRPKQCRIQYCLFYNDRPKQLSDDPKDIAQGNYIAGIDVMYAQDWIIRDNVFLGIQGRTYEGRGAIFLWFDTRGCTIERNIIVDCDVGLQLGNPHRADGVQYHCVGCVARNNFITRAPEAGIVTVYTKDCRLLHNTIHDPQSRLGRLIRMVFTNDGLLVANNLLSGPAWSNESLSDIRFAGNLIKDMTDAFADPARGNLHWKEPGAARSVPVRASKMRVEPDAQPSRTAALRAGATPRSPSNRGQDARDTTPDGVTTSGEVIDDIDGQPRGARPDIGADEITALSPGE